MKGKMLIWLKKIWLFIKPKCWYIFLLIISTAYIWYYRFEIYDLKEINARNLVFLLWLLLLMLPLFSEMEFLGIKVKKEVEKEVEKATEEVKSSLQTMQSQISQMQIRNSVANNFSFGNSSLASEEKLEELIQLVRGFQGNSNTQKDNTPNEAIKQTEAPDQNDSRVCKTQNNTYLGKVRYLIEVKLFQLCSKIGYDTDMPISKMLQILQHTSVISSETYELTNEVRKITNRAAHGEIISNEYISFVKKVYPEIARQLDTAYERLKHVTCPRCKFSGFSALENVCPQCGYVNDD